jgi:serpin B
MGMPSAFSSAKADLSGIDGTKVLFVSSIFHQALISINERGTEAAAGTGVGLTRGYGPSAPIFLADHPFMFMIQERVTGTILFLGRIINPIG